MIEKEKEAQGDKKAQLQVEIWTWDLSIRSPMLNHWSHHLGLTLKKHSFSRQPLLFWPKRIISAFLFRN